MESIAAVLAEVIGGSIGSMLNPLAVLAGFMAGRREPPIAVSMAWILGGGMVAGAMVFAILNPADFGAARILAWSIGATALWAIVASLLRRLKLRLRQHGNPHT